MDAQTHNQTNQKRRRKVSCDGKQVIGVLVMWLMPQFSNWLRPRELTDCNGSVFAVRRGVSVIFGCQEKSTFSYGRVVGRWGDLAHLIYTEREQEDYPKSLSSWNSILTLSLIPSFDKCVSWKSEQFLSHPVSTYTAAFTLLRRCISSHFITLIQWAHSTRGIGFRSCWFACSMLNRALL